MAPLPLFNYSPRSHPPCHKLQDHALARGSSQLARMGVPSRRCAACVGVLPVERKGVCTTSRNFREGNFLASPLSTLTRLDMVRLCFYGDCQCTGARLRGIHAITHRPALPYFGMIIKNPCSIGRQSCNASTKNKNSLTKKIFIKHYPQQ